MKKFLEWLSEHLYIRSVNLNPERDNDFPENLRPDEAVEVGVKISF